MRQPIAPYQQCPKEQEDILHYASSTQNALENCERRSDSLKSRLSEQPKTKKQRTRQKAVRILLVENDQKIRQELEEYLTAKGYTVLSASSAAVALMKAITADVDLLISSLSLPDLQGTDLVRALKAQAPHLPVIALDAEYSEQAYKECEGAGATCLLGKPLDYEKLEDELMLVKMARLNLEVVVLDPDPIHRRFTSKEFQARGCEVRGFSDIVLALAQLSSNNSARPSLFLIDADIPHAEEFLAWTKQQKAVACVFSETINPKREEKMMRSGAALIVKKPIQFDSLLNQIYFLANG